MIEVTGSLQVKNKIYQAVLSYKDSGKWKTKWVSTKIKAVKGNKKKAEAELERIKVDFQERNNNFQEKNNNANVKNEDISFIEYMKKWLKMTKSSIEETTYNGYEKLINGRMTTYFQDKNITLQYLKPQHIQDFYQYLIDANLSGNTVKHYHANIRKALQYAVKTDILISNPADKVVLPKVMPYIAEHYTVEEIFKLFNIIRNTKIQTPVILGAFYGFRRSEIVGLKWSAIDFVNKTILINHIVTQITENHSNKLIQKDRTKTKSSTRTLPLLPAVETYLLDLMEKQNQNKLICGNSYNQNFLDYICVDTMGTLLNPDYVSHAFTKLLKKNNLRLIRFHDLRHTCASLLLNEGIDMKLIQSWLGHSNYNTTANIYAHLDTKSMDKSANAISNVLSKEDNDLLVNF